MSNQIVQVNVSVSLAPAPSTLQQTGAMISQGQTTLSEGTYSLITQPSDLTPLLVAPLASASATWSTGVLTITASASLPAHLPVGAKFLTTLAGYSPAGVNGQYIATVTGATTFTVALAGSGSVTVEGTFTITDDLVSEVATFFDQGQSVSVYVLELGDATVATQITNLTAFIAGTPNFFYSYLVPRSWDGVSQFLAFLAGFESTTSKTYFFVTTTTSNYTDYTALMKCVVALVETPVSLGRPIAEFSMAAVFWKTLSYSPSGSNKVTKLCFAFVFGVTAYPTTGNATLLASLKAANVNVIGTAAEGGLTNTMVLWGTTMDGQDFTWWYSVDWAQINLDLDISNAVINGSNNPLNPLYYNQTGINVLQDVAVAVFNEAVTDGMALGPTIQTTLSSTDFTSQFDQGAFDGEMVVNAVPFGVYTAANPSDYGIGKYAGLGGIYIPQNGFKLVIFNLNVTNIVGGAA